mmetsp:Transcript_3502/g.8662  ORF Transcript_3502/g.8662 Transcript_3502/m.8662 type:complete len:242 (+) Transcript_3502:117-842(+)
MHARVHVCRSQPTDDIASHCAGWHHVRWRAGYGLKMGSGPAGFPCVAEWPRVRAACSAVCDGRLGGIAVGPAIILTVVAAASTAMHTSQMQVCPTCLLSPPRLKWAQSAPVLLTLRRLDVSCVLVSLVTTGSCLGWVSKHRRPLLPDVPIVVSAHVATEDEDYCELRCGYLTNPRHRADGRRGAYGAGTWPPGACVVLPGARAVNHCALPRNGPDVHLAARAVACGWRLCHIPDARAAPDW